MMTITETQLETDVGGDDQQDDREEEWQPPAPGPELRLGQRGAGHENHCQREEEADRGGRLAPRQCAGGAEPASNRAMWSKKRSKSSKISGASSIRVMARLSERVGVPPVCAEAHRAIWLPDTLSHRPKECSFQ